MPEVCPPNPDLRPALLRGLAWACLLLVLVVASLSASLRLGRAGLGCADWPRCYGRALAAAEPGAATTPAAAPTPARLAHRAAALGTLATVLALLVLALYRRPRYGRAAALAGALLALTLLLAVLGRWSAGARVPAIALGNLLGGLLMIALASRLTLAARTPAAPASGWTIALVLALLLQAALGGLVSTTFAGLACTDLAGCWRAAAQIGWGTLDPWRVPQVVAAGGAAEPGALAQLLHRAGAIVVFVAVLAGAARALRRGRPGGAALLVALLALAVAVGGRLGDAGLPPGLAMLHHLVAALLVAAAARFVD